MDININDVLKNILNNSINSPIDINNIFNIPKFHDTLFIQIVDNKIYTLNPIKEERHFQVLNQLKNVCLNFKIPNTLFAYSTRDEYQDKSHFIFTHSVRNDSKTNNILAPCFTFDSYPEKNPSNFISYNDTYNDLTIIGNKYKDNKLFWNEKKNNIVFVGSITTNNYRDKNTSFTFDENSSVKSIIKNLDAASGDNFIGRNELAQYKYLLHLNGNGGAYASRLKYLMLTGSLVFYITKFNNENIQHNEYWMNHTLFNKCIIVCRDVEECQSKINYFIDHPDEAYSIINDGYNYTTTILNPKNVLLYWKLLLETYSSRIINPINNIIFNNPY